MKYFVFVFFYLSCNFLTAQTRLDSIIEDFIDASIDENAKLGGLPSIVSVRILQKREDTILEMDMVYSRYKSQFVKGEPLGCINEVPVYFLNETQDSTLNVTIEDCAVPRSVQDYGFGLSYTKACDTLTYIGKGMPILSQRIFILENASWKLISDDLTLFALYLQEHWELKRLGWSCVPFRQN